ncbi:MAG TPA: alpha/beta hydrolase family protein [Polyangiaceae bacterium]
MFGIAKALVLQAAASFDRAVTLAVRVGLPADDDAPLDWGKEARLAFLEALVERYGSLDLGGYFADPSPLTPVAREQGFFSRRLRRTDLTWPSGYVPFLPEMREVYGRTLENQWASARLFRSDAPRPVAILVHGYLMGRLAIDERVWPVGRLDALGVDSALVVLPFHGRRGDPARTGRPEFPGRDPRVANEGFRQIVGEIRQLAAWLRRNGHPAVGVIGMSLGGYTAALAATVEELDFVVPIIPLASLADFAFEQGSLSESPELRAREHALLERAYAVASPLARPPLVSPERVLVLGGKADRITPLSHAKRLARHFQVPLTTWHGGHLLQLGRGDAWGRIAELLRRASVI